MNGKIDKDSYTLYKNIYIYKYICVYQPMCSCMHISWGLKGLGLSRALCSYFGKRKVKSGYNE